MIRRECWETDNGLGIGSGLVNALQIAVSLWVILGIVLALVFQHGPIGESASAALMIAATCEAILVRPYARTLFAGIRRYAALHRADCSVIDEIGPKTIVLVFGLRHGAGHVGDHADEQPGQVGHLQGIEVRPDGAAEVLQNVGLMQVGDGHVPARRPLQGASAAENGPVRFGFGRAGWRRWRQDGDGVEGGGRQVTRPGQARGRCSGAECDHQGDGACGGDPLAVHSAFRFALIKPSAWSR